jgi:general secretion pathway protein E
MDMLVQQSGTAAGDTADSSSPKKGLCEYLVASEKLDPANIERALRLQQEQDAWEPIGSILVKLGFVSERDIAECLARQLELPLVDKKDFPDEFSGDERVSHNFLKENKTLILDEDEDRLHVAMADPRNRFVLDALAMFTGKTVLPGVGVASEIESALKQRTRTANDIDETSDSIDYASRFLDDAEHLKELASEAPVIKLVNLLIHKAVESSASDIHIEPFENNLKVRYRIDGILQDVDAPPARSATAVVSRIKIMANLNIAECRLPQDGRFKVRVFGKELDLRVSTVPTMHGESVVLRLLHRDDGDLDFGPLGFSPDMEREMLNLLSQPHGIILVTGPTGSGKTTTLYAALKHLNTPERKILTVEDPVEYNIEGVNQIQAKSQIGLSFANALRSIVRQDPDVIMIGEMRDEETAKIAVESALTGHLVLSTLHTNDAAGSITRLLDMGVEDYLLTSTVNAVQAQRLVRTLCPQCREAYSPMDEVVQRWRLDRFAAGGSITLYRAVGCEHCGNTGYSGRSAIIELLVMTENLRQLVLKHTDAGTLARAAVADGMHTMFDDGLRKAVAGQTSLEEVLRVTQDSHVSTVPITESPTEDVARTDSGSHEAVPMAAENSIHGESRPVPTDNRRTTFRHYFRHMMKRSVS